MQKYKSESNMHMQLAQYIRLQYPQVLFHTDFAAGIKMTMGQAVKNKQLQSGRGWPDLFVAQPMRGMHGMAIELKREGAIVLRKDGTRSTEAHISEQFAVLDELKKLGYGGVIAAGFEQAKYAVDKYLKHGVCPSEYELSRINAPRNFLYEDELSF
jgi:hypothetical protein